MQVYMTKVNCTEKPDVCLLLCNNSIQSILARETENIHILLQNFLDVFFYLAFLKDYSLSS